MEERGGELLGREAPYLCKLGAQEQSRSSLATCSSLPIIHLVSACIPCRMGFTLFSPFRCASMGTVAAPHVGILGRLIACSPRPRLVHSSRSCPRYPKTLIVLSYYLHILHSDSPHPPCSTGLRLCCPLGSCSIVVAKAASWVARTHLEGNPGQTGCSGTFTVDLSATAARNPPPIQATCPGPLHH